MEIDDFGQALLGKPDCLALALEIPAQARQHFIVASTFSSCWHATLWRSRDLTTTPLSGAHGRSNMRLIRKCQFVFAITFACALRAVASDVEIPAVMLGQCENLSKGGKANLRLTLVEREGQSFRGYLDVDGELEGSGIVSGTCSANRLEFVMDVPESPATIKFSASSDAGRSYAGGYVYSLRNPGHNDPKKQVGRWSVELADESSTKRLLAVATERAREFKFPHSEIEIARSFEEVLNHPVKDPETGRSMSGAQYLFKSIHPIGTGEKITVDSVRLEWRDDKLRYSIKHLSEIGLTMTLYWKGLITTNGRTTLSARADPSSRGTSRPENHGH